MATYTTLIEEEKKQKSSEEQTTKAPEVNGVTEKLQTSAAAAPAVQPVTQQKVGTIYDPLKDTAYQQAMSALQQAKDSRPTYQNSYDEQLQQLYDQITGRKSFNYDMTADTMYQQYKQQYKNQGQMAMRDTMGQAAALTGGYGSSYGQSVGQQQYNAYLQNLNDVVPELYGMAYQQYQDQGNALKDQYSMMGQLADDEYNKYQDSMAQYWQNLSYQQGVVDDLYNKGMQQAELNYARQQEAYSKLSDLVLNFGYVPNAENLEEAGMSQAEYDSLRAYYKKMNPDPVASSGGGGGYSSGGQKTNWYEVVKQNAEEDDASGTVSNATIIGDIASAYMDGKITKAQAAELESKYNKPYLNI